MVKVLWGKGPRGLKAGGECQGGECPGGMCPDTGNELGPLESSALFI